MNALKVLTLAACMGIATELKLFRMHAPAALFLAIFMTILKCNLHRSIKSTRYEELCIHCSLKE